MPPAANAASPVSYADARLKASYWVRAATPVVATPPTLVRPEPSTTLAEPDWDPDIFWDPARSVVEINRAAPAVTTPPADSDLSDIFWDPELFTESVPEPSRVAPTRRTAQPPRRRAASRRLNVVDHNPPKRSWRSMAAAFTVLALVPVAATAADRVVDRPAPKGAMTTLLTPGQRVEIEGLTDRRSEAAPKAAVPVAAPAPPARFTMAFAGDISGERIPEASMAEGMDARLAAVKPLLERADVAFGNLETAVTPEGDPAPKKFVFSATEPILGSLARAGFDGVSMANNHGMDMGNLGLLHSLDARSRAPLSVVGIGANEADAYKPATFDVKGQRVGVIAATQVLDDHLIGPWSAGPDKPGLASAKRVPQLVDAVKRARENHDVVVVFLHWGIELQTCPSGTQQELAQTLSAAGADAVVGGHAHRLQGGGFLGPTYIAYGLGNFAFYGGSGAGVNTGVLTLDFEGRQVIGARFDPAVIRNYRPEPLPGPEAERARAAWEGQRACTGLESAPPSENSAATTAPSPAPQPNSPAVG